MQSRKTPIRAITQLRYPETNPIDSEIHCKEKKQKDFEGTKRESIHLFFNTHTNWRKKKENNVLIQRKSS